MGLWESISNAGQSFVDNVLLDGSGGVNWRNIGGIAGGIAGATGVFDSPQQKVGYQGGIPDYLAMREQLPVSWEGRRPGSAGRRYFTDTLYADAPGTATPSVSEAQAVIDQQRQSLTAGQNTPGVRSMEFASRSKPTEAAPVPEPNTDNSELLALIEAVMGRSQDLSAQEADTGGTDTGGSTDTGGTDTGGSTDTGGTDTGGTDTGGSTDTGGTDTGGSTEAPYQPPAPPAYVDDSGLVLGPGGANKSPSIDPNFQVIERDSPVWHFNSQGSLVRQKPSGPLYKVHIGDGHFEQYTDSAAARARANEIYGAGSYAQGGIVSALKGGGYLNGKTDGMADEVPATVDGIQEAAIAHGEFVVPADVVSHIGNGNSEAGAEELYAMMDRIRQARTGSKEQGKQINPRQQLPG